jgi:ankyrin repeat protein
MCDVCEQVDREFDGKTALHHAAFSGHTDVIKTLLEFGADKDITVSIP